jgi:hypothetical protein
VLLYQSKNDVARNCVGYRSIGVGVRIYGLSAEHGLLDRCLGWGNEGPDVGIKSGKAETCAAKNSVGLGYFPVRNVSNSILGGPNIYVPDAEITKDNILLQTERVNRDQEFADPVNFDFRLQSTSTMRGAAPDGKDRGPFPYQANVFFVKPTGDDAADGLSVTAAWKTLARAVKSARPGDTVYFEEGVYHGGATIRAGKAGAAPVSWRARGAGKVRSRHRQHERRRAFSQLSLHRQGCGSFCPQGRSPQGHALRVHGVCPGGAAFGRMRTGAFQQQSL